MITVFNLLDYCITPTWLPVIYLLEYPYLTHLITCNLPIWLPVIYPLDYCFPPTLLPVSTYLITVFHLLDYCIPPTWLKYSTFLITVFHLLDDFIVVSPEGTTVNQDFWHFIEWDFCTFLFCRKLTTYKTVGLIDQKCFPQCTHEDKYVHLIK